MVEIREVRGKREIREFIEFPFGCIATIRILFRLCTPMKKNCFYREEVPPLPNRCSFLLRETGRR